MFDYDKKQALKTLENWFDGFIKAKCDDFCIHPFKFSSYDGIVKGGGKKYFWHRLPPVFDFVLFNNSNERYAISITTDTFTDEILSECDDYGVDVYYIDMYWILEQNKRPSKIECIQLN